MPIEPSGGQGPTSLYQQPVIPTQAVDKTYVAPKHQMPLQLATHDATMGRTLGAAIKSMTFQMEFSLDGTKQATKSGTKANAADWQNLTPAARTQLEALEKRYGAYMPPAGTRNTIDKGDHPLTRQQRIVWGTVAGIAEEKGRAAGLSGSALTEFVRTAVAVAGHESRWQMWDQDKAGGPLVKSADGGAHGVMQIRRGPHPTAFGKAYQADKDLAGNVGYGVKYLLDLKDRFGTKDRGWGMGSADNFIFAYKRGHAVDQHGGHKNSASCTKDGTAYVKEIADFAKLVAKAMPTIARAK